MAARRDVTHNRVAILRAASSSLVGPSASAPELHKEAVARTGLARATVYRHFPDHRSLAEAALGGFLRLMERDATAPDASFRQVLTTMLRYQAAMRPAASLVRTLPAAVQQRLMHHIVTTLTPAFEAARARGELRPDFGPADIETVMRMLESAASTTADPGRFIGLLVDGVFAGPIAAHGSHFESED